MVLFLLLLKMSILILSVLENLGKFSFTIKNAIILNENNAIELVGIGI